MRARWLLLLTLGCGPLPPAEGVGTSGGEATGAGEVPTGEGTGEPGATSGAGDEAGDVTTGSAVIDCTQPVQLPDEAVALAVRLRLGLLHDPVPVDRLADLSGIAVPSFLEVVTLAGLECFPNLEQVMIRSSSLTDLGPLAGMTRLTWIYLRSTALTDLGPLATLPALAGLDLQSDAVVDYAPLAGHPTLQELEVVGTTAVSLAPLAEIPNLWRLRITESGLTDLVGLGGASALTEIDVSDNQIADLSPLGAVPTLETLYAYRNPLAGLGGLEGLPALAELNVADTGLTGLVAVAPDSLVWLVADGNAIADLGPLAGHTRLKGAFLTNNAVTSLAPLVGAPWIDDPCARLDVTGNPLDQETVEVVVPEICAFGARVDTELVACEPMGDVQCAGLDR